jgi:hypothetical protein
MIRLLGALTERLAFLRRINEGESDPDFVVWRRSAL